VGGTGLERLREAGLQVETGLMEADARALNPGFIRRMEFGLPWVRLKLAASLDGRTAMASGESQWITGAASREAVQRLRARSSAVVTGSGTVVNDRPSLTVRPEEWRHGEYHPLPVRQPLRVVLDSALRCPVDAPVFTQPGDSLLFCHAGADERARQRMLDAGIRVLETGVSEHGLDLLPVLQELARRECNEVLFECGASLGGELVRQQLLDELVLFVAPTLLGSSARPLLQLPEIERMSQQHRLRLMDVRQVGDDLQLTLRPERV
jgi:diaminohydroxyphosphoribosylaminopyrimidine deaminase/5-amino-6-(5-phosphoribosylamino)uracil reductase